MTYRQRTQATTLWCKRSWTNCATIVELSHVMDPCVNEVMDTLDCPTNSRNRRVNVSEMRTKTTSLHRAGDTRITIDVLRKSLLFTSTRHQISMNYCPSGWPSRWRIASYNCSMEDLTTGNEISWIRQCPWISEVLLFQISSVSSVPFPNPVSEETRTCDWLDALSWNPRFAHFCHPTSCRSGHFEKCTSGESSRWDWDLQPRNLRHARQPTFGNHMLDKCVWWRSAGWDTCFFFCRCNPCVSLNNTVIQLTSATLRLLLSRKQWY